MQPTLANFIKRAAARKPAAAAAPAPASKDRRVVAVDVSVGVLALCEADHGGGCAPLLHGTHIVLSPQSTLGRR